MTSTHRTLSVPSGLRRGLGAAGAAVVVAFVGTATLAPAEAEAAGISTGLRYAAEPGREGARPAAHPANLPPASTLAMRYRVVDGRLVALGTD